MIWDDLLSANIAMVVVNEALMTQTQGGYNNGLTSLPPYSIPSQHWIITTLHPAVLSQHWSTETKRATSFRPVEVPENSQFGERHPLTTEATETYTRPPVLETFLIGLELEGVGKIRSNEKQCKNVFSGCSSFFPEDMDVRVRVNQLIVLFVCPYDGLAISPV